MIEKMRNQKMQDLSRIGHVTEIKIDDKRTLRYLKAGKGDPLILLHTIRTQLDYFQEAIPELAKHYTVYALDLPGHGYSSVDSKANYDEPYFREAVIAFIEKLDLKDVKLAGESIGAVLALTVASTIPERVSNVVASNSYDYDTRYADGVRRGNFFANFVLGNYESPKLGAIIAENENWLFLGLVLRGGLRKKDWMPNALLNEFIRAGRRKGFSYVARNVFANWRSWGQARVLYSGVKASVKLIYGDHDWSTLKERQRTAKELGNVDIITIENTGHFAFVDNPQKLVDIILEN
jgi:pimeloyl-ACP methyl ester carboxylesterase